MRAGFDLPQLADAIQLDNMAVTWIYRHPDVRTVVLRPTNIVGPTVQNALCRFLRLPRVPYLAGFNPMTQFVHAHDLARAIERALGSDVVGVFNVGGAAVIPWRTALELAGAKTFPILGESLFRLYFHAAGLMRQYLADFYKYPCIIADARFRDTFGWQPLIGVRESIWATVAEARAHQEEQRARRTHAS